MEPLSDWTRNQQTKHEAGSIVGRPPWGYQIVQHGDLKTLKPTAAGRKWVPSIFAWIIAGFTLDQVAQKLNENHVDSGSPDGLWYDMRIQRMIRSTTYSGERPVKGRQPLPVPPLVTRATQDEAIAALASRALQGASTVRHPKALLTGLRCGHPECPGAGMWPMYRHKSRSYLYRCVGNGPRRTGCPAPMINLDLLDTAVLNRFPNLRSFDLNQQRAFLANRDIRVWKIGDVINLKIDGRAVQVRSADREGDRNV